MNCESLWLKKHKSGHHHARLSLKMQNLSFVGPGKWNVIVIQSFSKNVKTLSRLRISFSSAGSFFHQHFSLTVYQLLPSKQHFPFVIKLPDNQNKEKWNAPWSFIFRDPRLLSRPYSPHIFNITIFASDSQRILASVSSKSVNVSKQVGISFLELSGETKWALSCVSQDKTF